jgi:hypothetical protein
LLVGAKLGNREIEEQADAFRIRALREVKSSPRQARKDAETARTYVVTGDPKYEQYYRDVTARQT